MPWRPWTPASVLFDPWCDGGYTRFIHASYRDNGWADAVNDRERNQLAGPGSASTGGGITSVSRLPGAMEVWWVGSDGSVRDAFRYDA